MIWQNSFIYLQLSFDLFLYIHHSLHKSVANVLTPDHRANHPDRIEENASYFRVQKIINNNKRRTTDIRCTVAYLTTSTKKQQEKIREEAVGKRPRNPPTYIREKRKEKKTSTYLLYFSVRFHSTRTCFVSVCLSFVRSINNAMATGPTANRPLTKTFCAACGKGFTPRDAMQIYQENYYHPPCFCCSNCGNSLAGKPFYPKPNNKFQCENCNHSLAPMYVRWDISLYRKEISFILVVASAIKRFNRVSKQNDFKNVIITAIVFGEIFSSIKSLNKWILFSCCKCNAVIPDGKISGSQQVAYELF